MSRQRHQMLRVVNGLKTARARMIAVLVVAEAIVTMKLMIYRVVVTIVMCCLRWERRVRRRHVQFLVRNNKKKKF